MGPGVRGLPNCHSYLKKKIEKDGLKIMKKQRLQKLFIALLLGFLLLGTTIGAYAWWDSLQKQDDGIIDISEGVELVITGEVPSSGKLVPTSAVLQDGNVTSITVTYTLNLNKRDSIADAIVTEILNLTVSVTNIKVDGVDNPYNLIKVEYSSTTISNDSVDVILTFSIREITDGAVTGTPSAQEAYDALANKSITYTVTFIASKQA